MSDISNFSPLWGEWYIKDLIGKGTFGAVYRAEKTEYGNTYTSAVKHISIPNDSMNAESLISEGVVSDEGSVIKYYDAVRDKMISEINFCYALRGNTNIVSYEDHCIIPKTDGAGYDIFIRMEHLTALPKYMRENSFTEKDVVKLGIDICSALEVLDKHNIIHRDIKPANIFVNSVGVYKLGDFGESKVLSNTNVGMTVRGTYTYMSPEISMGRSANITADIYSLGIVMYRLLNGNKAPFVPADMNSVDAQTVENANIRRFRGDKMPLPLYCKSPQLASVIMKACEHSPAERWQKPRDMRKALEALLEGSTQQAVPVQSQQQVYTSTASAPTMTPPQTNGNASQTPQKPSSQPPVKKRGKLGIIIPVIVVSLIAACVVTILVFQKPPTKGSGKDEASDTQSVVSPSGAESGTVSENSTASTPDTPAESSSGTSEQSSSAQSSDQSSGSESSAPSEAPAAEPVSLTIAAQPSKTTYSLNEELDTSGVKITAGYSDGTEKEIPVSDCTFSGFDASSSGEKTVTVSFGGKSASFTVTVEQGNTSVLGGKCGSDVSYALDKDSGVLTISGRGAMDDFSLSYFILENGSVGVKCSAPWSDNADLIKSVRVEDGVTRIGSYSFYDCTAMTSVRISDTVKILGESSFRGCSSLGAFEIPAGLEDMEDEVFVNCKSLAAFTADVRNADFSTQDGVLYSKSKRELLKCPQAKKGTVTIPYGTTNIENWAFDGCADLTAIDLPESVSTIGGYAFSGCTGVSKIVIGKNVSIVGGAAFRGWKSGQRIEIPYFTEKPSMWASDWDVDCKADILFAGAYG